MVVSLDTMNPLDWIEKGLTGELVNVPISAKFALLGAIHDVAGHRPKEMLGPNPALTNAIYAVLTKVLDETDKPGTVMRRVDQWLEDIKKELDAN